MDKKTFSIGILSLMAVILVVANYLPLPQPSASANSAVKDTLSEYQMVTAHNTDGGESLYVINRDGQMAIFQYDNNTRALRLVATRGIPELMGGK
jgi:hypothetical protein